MDNNHKICKMRIVLLVMNLNKDIMDKLNIDDSTYFLEKTLPILNFLFIYFFFLILFNI